MEPQSPDAQVLIDLANMRMPFGKYAGSLLLRLPERYLLWFQREGFPKGRLGEQMAMMLEIKTNGLEHLLRPFAPTDRHFRRPDGISSS